MSIAPVSTGRRGAPVARHCMAPRQARITRSPGRGAFAQAAHRWRLTPCLRLASLRSRQTARPISVSTEYFRSKARTASGRWNGPPGSSSTPEGSNISCVFIVNLIAYLSAQRRALRIACESLRGYPERSRCGGNKGASALAERRRVVHSRVSICSKYLLSVSPNHLLQDERHRRILPVVQTADHDRRLGLVRTTGCGSRLQARRKHRDPRS
jgi:hypothetical protein